MILLAIIALITFVVYWPYSDMCLRRELRKAIPKDSSMLNNIEREMFIESIIENKDEIMQEIEEAIEHQEALDEMFPMPEKKVLFE